MPRKSKSQETSRCEGLRAMWELPYLNQTLGFLQDKLKLAHFTIQEFEDSLLERESWPLFDIFTRLLRFLTGNTSVVLENFEQHLSELVLTRKKVDENLKGRKLADISPEDKVQVLKWLVDEVIQTKDEDVSDYLNDHFSPHDLRPITAGHDAFNNTYWYFGDQRLYKENTSRKAGKKDWETVCVTLKDWRFLLKQFRKSNNPQEKELFHYLSDELFPLVRAQLESGESAKSGLCATGRGELEVQEELELSAMLKETDGMPNETNGNSVKCELSNVKVEMKEEAVKSVEPESGGIPTLNSNPVSNGEVDVKLKLENGPDKNLQETKKGGDEKPSAPPTEEAPPTTPVLSNQQPTVPVTSQQGVQSQPHISMDAPYIQQQNQIFVFSTGLANQAAECVMQGQYKSILAFHMDQPGTKKILQKLPLKMSHMNKSAGMPLYSMANMRPPHTNMMKNEPRPRMPGANPSSSAAQVAQWVQQQNANLQEQGMNFPPVNPGFSPTHPSMPANMQIPGGPMGPNFAMMSGNPSFDMFMDGGHSAASANLLQSKVPNENLTPEQLHRREEQLANLRKIQQMLFPEQRQHHQQMFGPGGPGMAGGPGMMQGNMQSGMFQQNMMASQQNMGSQQGMMMSPGPMSPPNNMMSPQQQFMMSQNMSQFGPGPGPQPQNMQNLTPAQREWVRLQQEFMMDKGRKMRHHQMAHQLMQHSSQGPPPSYHSSIAHKIHASIGMNNPTSPNTNGPLSSPQMSAQSCDPQDPLGMFVGPAQRRPSMDALDPSGGMNPGMSSPMGPFEPGMMPGPGGANMPPVPMGQFHNGMPASRKMLGHLHRAGNPEQFQPEVLMGGPGPGSGPNSVNNSVKPPPSYTQSQKRKRDDMEELYKNLQPTPSPQQMNYLNQFEGQELTITKQLNTAYHEQSSTSDSQNNQFPHNQPVNSPLHAHGPGSNKSPVAVAAHQVSNPGALGSPSVSRPGPSPLSGASMRLSHYDPPPVGSPNTPTSKAAMSNITSASLANLAKGVEHLSNQMQQNMMQGGPFHSIQIQGQMTNPGQGNSNHPPSSTTPNSNMPQNSGQPSVNNTYVNATMSIQQLNIQSVNAPSNYNPSMQVQQMNNDSSATSHMGMPMGPGGMPPSSGNACGPGMSTVASMSQSQSSVQSLSHANASKPQFPSPPVSQIPTGQAGPMVPVSGAKMNNSPNFAPASAVGNANIQIQPKAPNTIQYLPANPPATQANMNNSLGQAGIGNPMSQGAMSNPMSQPGMGNPMGQPVPGMVNQMPQNAMGNPMSQPMGQPGMAGSMAPSNMNPSMAGMKRPEMEFMNRFSAPVTNLEGKIPTSKLNYLPNSSQNAGLPNPRMGGSYPNQAMQAMQQQLMLRGGGPQSHPNMPSQNGISNMGPMNSMGGGMPSMGSPMGGMGSPNAISGMPANNTMNMASGMPQMSNGMNPMMPGGGGPGMNNMSHMNNGMGNMNNMGPMGSVPYGNNPSFSPGGQPQMMSSMMQSQQMQFQAHSMSSMPMQGPMMSRQANPSAMRMSSPPQGMMQPGARSMGYNAQFQQFQQQIYSQGRPPRQMSPIPNMMGNPVQPYMDMMPNMPGPT